MSKGCQRYFNKNGEFKVSTLYGIYISVPKYR